MAEVSQKFPHPIQIFHTVIILLSYFCREILKICNICSLTATSQESGPIQTIFNRVCALAKIRYCIKFHISFSMLPLSYSTLT